MTHKEDVLERARRRAEKARELIRSAQELHTEGRISLESLLHITSEAEAGYPYKAQEDLERLLARQMMEAAPETLTPAA